jgi:soluble lytic murein transglycosylase
VLGAEPVLLPASHPPSPDEAPLLWLAPVRDDAVAARPAFARLASGIAFYQAGKSDEALRLLSSRSSLPRPAGDYAAYYAALAQLILGRAEVARREFAALSARMPSGYLSEAALTGEAQAATAAGDHAGAQRLYERLVTGTPMAPDDVWFRLGRAAQAAGDRARAVAAFRHVYEQFPLSRYASDAMSALSSLHGIDSLAAGSTRYRLELGRADLLFGAKRYDEARTLFERLRPHASGAERERVELRLAACLYFAKQYARARRTLGPYRDRDGTFQAEARFLELMSIRALRSDDEFERLAEELIAKFPRTAWAEQTLDMLGTHYIQRDRDEDADSVFRRVLAHFPSGRYAERAAWKVGWRASRFGKTGEAVEVFEHAAANFPRSDYRPAYLYWAARGRQALGEHEAAALTYVLVRTDYRYSYYGRLADAVLERSAVPVRAAFARSGTPFASTAAESKTASIPPNAEAIRLMLGVGLYDDAVREIRYAQHRWGDSSLLQATIAWIEHQKGDLLAGARAARRAYPQYLSEIGEALPSELAAVIFPLGYWNLIREHAARDNLDPYLLAALIAQESGFIPDIRSPANATGLMQLMPGTAQRYARKLGLAPYSPALLTRPDANVRLGVAYFADLMQEFGKAHLALASYNAGESRVRRWIAERQNLSPDEFIEDIPFPETQNYVKKILGAAENYRRVYGSDVALPSDPVRAIPSLASRTRGSAQPPPGIVRSVVSTSARTKAAAVSGPAAKAQPATGKVKSTSKPAATKPQSAQPSRAGSGRT